MVELDRSGPAAWPDRHRGARRAASRATMRWCSSGRKSFRIADGAGTGAGAARLTGKVSAEEFEGPILPSVRRPGAGPPDQGLAGQPGACAEPSGSVRGHRPRYRPAQRRWPAAGRPRRRLSRWRHADQELAAATFIDPQRLRARRLHRASRCGFGSWSSSSCRSSSMVDFSLPLRSAALQSSGGPEDVWTLANYRYFLLGFPGNPDGWNFVDLAVFGRTLVARRWSPCSTS